MSGTLLVGDSQAVSLYQPLINAGVPLLGIVGRAGVGTAELKNSGEVLHAVQSLRPDRAIVILGGNDSAGPNLESAITFLRSQLPEEVLWIGPMSSTDLDVDRRHARVAEMQRALAARLGFEWVDGRALSRDLIHTPDGVHFTDRARTTLAKRVIAQLQIRLEQLGWGWVLGVAAVAAASAVGLAWIWSRW